MNYASPSPVYRAPESSYRDNGGRNYDSFRSGEVARSQQSGGSHFFGGHNSGDYGGKAPKAYNYGGGHSGWGGGGGWKAPKAPRKLPRKVILAEATLVGAATQVATSTQAITAET
jgi:hypothetical protein